MLVLGIPEDQFWRMTLREIAALRRAHIHKVRLEWNGAAAAFAGYFEGHREKHKGRPITAENFLPSTAGHARKRERVDAAIDAAVREMKRRGDAGQIPKWALAAEQLAKQQKRKEREARRAKRG